MEKIFDQAKDKYVANFVVYGKSADSKLYYKYDGTTYSNQVDRDVAKDAFLKGRLVIKVGNDYFYPTLMSSTTSDNVETIKIKTLNVTTVSSTATPSFVEWLTKNPS